MRGFSFLIIVLAIIAAILFFFRYDITVHSPLVVKLDRWTGQTWVANSGVYRGEISLLVNNFKI